ncbi:MAG: 5-(carboxyamino)imidazole ribonucleotide mutase [Bdellovibrionales bacterium]|nr:5-(carboxyamino)imidazole ribonucleotide mutase [Bdellovibrionales bacterium]
MGTQEKKFSSTRFSDSPQIGIVMGSTSDWPTMQKASEILDQFSLPHETKVVSAHRTPQLMAQYAEKAKDRGIKVIIAGAGGAAHLPGMIAAYTQIPVLGVPIKSKHLKGMDSLLSIVQMPFGVPVGTLAIGEAGAKNAALLAISILAAFDSELNQKLQLFRKKQTQDVLDGQLKS